MIETIKPLKRMPEKFALPGDYHKTIASIFCGIISGEECTITNYNRGQDIFALIELFEGLGWQISRNATEIKIYPSPEAGIVECAVLKYTGGITPLSLLIGLLIGKGQDCTLHYGIEINQDAIDLMVNFCCHRGIDLYHEADDREIIFRAGQLVPLECRLKSALPHLKNMLLMIGLCSDISVKVCEDIITPNFLEWTLAAFGAPVDIRDIKTRWVPDPIDPRKKIQEKEAEWKREIRVGRSLKPSGVTIEIPSDIEAAAALMELAVLKRKHITLLNVHLDDSLREFMKALNGAGIEIDRTGGHHEGNDAYSDLHVYGKAPKSRKLSGDTAQELADFIPYLSPMLATGDGTSIIRDMSEYSIWLNNPFVEISAGLENLGIKAGAIEDGLIIEGGKELDAERHGPFVNRAVALSFYICALAGKAKTEFDGFDIIRAHYHDLLDVIEAAEENQAMLSIRG